MYGLCMCPGSGIVIGMYENRCYPVNIAVLESQIDKVNHVVSFLVYVVFGVILWRPL